MLDRIEVLGAGGRAECGREPVAGRRMEDPRDGSDVVVAEAAADQLLHQEGLFVGAARGGDAADRPASIFLLDALELGCGAADRFVPGYFAPRIGDPLADHGLKDALAVGGITPGEAALDAGMSAVRLAVLIGHHAHHFVAAHLRLEPTPHAPTHTPRHPRPLRLPPPSHA